MSIADLLILAAIFLGIWLASRAVFRGGARGCSGSCENCGRCRK